MSVKNAPLAIAFLVGGVLVIAVAIPVTLSGVGGAPGFAGGCFPCGPPPPPKGTIIDLGGFIFIEPAFFVGIGLLVVGIYLLRQSIRTLGVRIRASDNAPPVHR